MRKIIDFFVTKDYPSCVQTSWMQWSYFSPHYQPNGRKLRFKDNRPGRKNISLFLQRHKYYILLGRPRKEQQLRYKSCNADTSSTNFAALRKLVVENNIDESRMANLDSSCSELEKEATCRMNKKRSLRSEKSSSMVVRVPTFKNVHRVKMMPPIFANGEMYEPLYIFKGKYSLSYK